MFGSCWFASRFAPWLSIFICSLSAFHVWISSAKHLEVDFFILPILQHCTYANAIVFVTPKRSSREIICWGDIQVAEINQKAHLENFFTTWPAAPVMSNLHFFPSGCPSWWLKWSFFFWYPPGTGSILARAPQFVTTCEESWARNGSCVYMTL